MCDCFGDLENYNTYKLKFDSCYDKALVNTLIEMASQKKKEEYMILINPEKRKVVNDNIEYLISIECHSVKEVIQNEVLSGNAQNPFPINFSSRDLKKLKRNPHKWNGQIIAFDAEVIEIKKGYHDKPYYKAKIDNEELWIASMISSGYEIKGNMVRILGYVTEIEDNDFVNEYHDLGFHILTFGVINLKTKQVAMFPGSEMQIKEWKNGKVPIGQ